MRTHIGRPVEFEAAKRDKFCTLVGVGVTRRHAAVSVGVAPSTVSRHMEADPLFAEQVRDAEIECELHLMSRIRLQSERSWRAAVWLLERMHPERYARGKAAPAAPSWDEMFGRFLALIDAEVADESLRQRLTQRLDDMALEELAAEEMENVPAFARTPAMPLPPAERPEMTPHAAPPPGGNGEPTRQNSQSKTGKAVAARSTLAPAQPAASIADLLGNGTPKNRQDRGPLDFCNTSPDVHEKRALAKVCR